MSVVLMYHAIYRDDTDLARIEVEDRPYAVCLRDFTAQMELVAKMNHGTLQPLEPEASLPAVIVTFDDGHISSVEHALPVLLALKIRAYFFVTTDFIGERANFCDWGDLQQLVDCKMIVGSHGTSHRFFDDMAQSEVLRELSDSKSVIETRLDTNAVSISFPGGRYTGAVLQTARAVGYQQIFGSDFGQLFSRAELLSEKSIKRIPVRRSTSLLRFEKIVSADRKLFAIEIVKTRGKQFIKLILGNRIYHGLYTALAKNR